ncbi:nucleic-acid-binding protein from transposon X-element [Trichonephila clavipes]|nr:nucleic-acid-binding protein from transposon X-element [Trichonephila clavipes]
MKGRKKRSPTPPDDVSTKKLKTFEVETTNKCDALEVPQSQENEDDTGVNVENHNVVRPAPPITIDNVNQVYPEAPEAYHAIRCYVDTEKLEAFTYQLNEEKEFKAVIRGMPSDTPPQEIIEDLLAFGINVNECHAMTNRKTGQPMPLFRVTLPRNEINRNIFNLTELCYLKIEMEPLRPKFGPSQCFRC